MQTIELLPPYIANQIAAGEVVGRGSSIVKELVENAVDAGATQVTISIEDGGRTKVQVVDNGKGMSVGDASMAFLRHATSKIRTAEELFSLRTFGFRGEALASIASVAEVELITKREEDELATRIVMRDGAEVVNEPCAAPTGTSITVTKLFYSVPARRKFLKTDSYEARLCCDEFMRIALVNPAVGFEYSDSRGCDPIRLLAQSKVQRIVALTRPSYAKKLLAVTIESPLLKISGYIATPDVARPKGRGEQYLFVNGRYFRNLRIYKAICNAYDRLIAPTHAPSYFLYIEVPSGQLDVNINPTKTEVKFEDEDSIVQIIASAVKQVLGRTNLIDSMDFEPASIDIPSYSASRTAMSGVMQIPAIKNYNPYSTPPRHNAFEPHEGTEQDCGFLNDGFLSSTLHQGDVPREGADDTLLGSAPQRTGSEEAASPQFLNVPERVEVMPLSSGKYLAVSMIEGLAIVHVNRARCRIEYEDVLGRLDKGDFSSQLLAIPHSVELNVNQKREVLEHLSTYESMGFYLEDDGGTKIKVKGIPVGFDIEDFMTLVTEPDRMVSSEERLAESLTRGILHETPPELNSTLARGLYDRLLATEEPIFTPQGLKIIEVIPSVDIESRFAR